MSCCPPNSAPFLAATHVPAGIVIDLPEVSFYRVPAVVGDGEERKALVLCPDIWGWNGGRTRQIADYFASQGFFCVVPQFLVPALEGGTDGDGFPPHFNMALRGAEFRPYMATFTFEHFFPRMAATKAYLEGLGFESASFAGFCFGGWLVCRTLCDPELGGGTVRGGQLGGPFWKSGAIAHPSIHLEEFVFGGKTAELMARVPVPLLLLPAKGDSPNYDAPGGEWTSPISCESVRFPEQDHGFVPRGDMGNEATANAVMEALALMTAFLAKH